MSELTDSLTNEAAGDTGIEADGDAAPEVRDVLTEKVEQWQNRLLDLGNRNALINTRFSDRSSMIEFDQPSTEEIWKKLAAESEAGADPMRFPWRRDLVPPPDDWQEYEDDPVTVRQQKTLQAKRREPLPPVLQTSLPDQPPPH